MKISKCYIFRAVFLSFLFITNLTAWQIKQKSESKKDSMKIITEATIDNYPAAGLNDWVTIHLPKLDEVIKTAEMGKSLILFINGMPLIDCRALVVNTNKKELRFLLERTDSSKLVWDSILKRPTAFTKVVNLGVGPKNGPPEQVGNLSLIVIRKWQFWVFVPFFFLFLLLVYLLGKKTNFLRDTPTKNTPDVGQRTFSLARSQMLFWTILMLTGFVFMWVATGEVNTITSSVLVLLGISSATALGARAIDNMPSESKNINDEITTGSYWKDILGGNSNDGVHRLQIIVWTLVLGFIFVCSIWSNMAMPEFNDTLLTLMGISSGTYIGFKLKE